MGNTINKEEIKRLSEESPEAKKFFGYVALRERHRGDTDIRRLLVQFNQAGAPIDYVKLKPVLKKAEEMGIGSLIEAPGKAPKWHWNISPTYLASEVFGSKRKIRIVRGVEPTSQNKEITIEKDGYKITTDLESASRLFKQLGLK